MAYEKILRWALLGLIGVIFLTPFIVADGSVFPNMFFPFITGKNFAFRILVELSLGLYILLALREPKYRPRPSVVMWVLLGFVVWMGIATITSVDPVKSFWSNFERMEGYLGLLHLFVYCIIVGAVVTTEDWWRSLFNISVTTGALQAVIALMQVFHVHGFQPSSQSGARADGTFGNATYLAVYMLFNVFLALFLLVQARRSRIAQIGYGTAVILQVAALYFTETRGALLGLLAGLVVTAIWIAWRAKGDTEWQILRKASIGVLIAIVVLIVGFFGIRNSSFVQHSATLQRIASISLTDRTTQSRFLIWHMAQQGFAQKPITGWGQENFNYVFNKYYSPAMYDQEQWFDRAHNAFLDWLIAGGLPAFLLYIGLFLCAAWAILRSELNVPEQAVLLGLLCAYAFNNLFVFDNLISYLYFFTIIGFAQGLSPRKPHATLFLSRPLSNQGLAVAAPIVLIVLGVGMWAINMPAIARAEELLNAVLTVTPVQTSQGTQGAPKDPKDNLSQFQLALTNPVWPGTPLGKQETVEQLLQLASASVAPSTSVSPDIKQQFYTTSHDAAASLLTMRPHDARLELFMGTFLGSFGQNQEGQQYLSMALKDSPLKQEILFEEGISLLNTGDKVRAVTYLKQAYDEAPAYRDAEILYAVGLYYAGQQAQGDALLNQWFHTTLVDDQRLLQVYVATKQYDRVIAIWQNRVNANPTDSQSHIGLASAYFASGNKAQTILELQRAAQLNSQLAPQIQATITQIQNGSLKPPQ